MSYHGCVTIISYSCLHGSHHCLPWLVVPLWFPCIIVSMPVCWCLCCTAGVPLGVVSIVSRRWCPPSGVPLLPRTDSLIILAPRRPLSPAHPTIVSSLVSRPRHLASLLTNGNFKLCYHEFPAAALRGRGMASRRSYAVISLF